jgi:PAS domain S-box-containing protein
MAKKGFNQQAKIMIVEDEPVVAKYIKMHLLKNGYNVTAMESKGEDAVRQAEELLPDLVLMDINLAGAMDGIQAAEKIHARFNIPLIYLTAFADDEILERCRITEPFGYLVKPFEPRALLSTIEIALYKHQLEKQLKESESRFRTLAESAPVGIFQTDLSGNCIYVNGKWCEISGLSSAEAMGRGWARGLHPEDQENIFAQLQQLVQGEEKFTLEFRFQAKDSRVAWVFSQAVALKDENGNRTGYMGTITDITDRKKLEERLLTAKKLESLGILAGGLAHDFNNLLSVIMGNISMVKDEITDRKPLYRMLGNAEKASYEAAALAQKLVTFSKGGWLQKRKISLQEILKNVIAQTLAGTGCSCEPDIPRDLLSLDADEGQLVQVFDNLLRNAVDAVMEKAASAAAGDNSIYKIILRAQNHEQRNSDSRQLNPGRYVKVTIEDNGVGIPQEHLDRVFDPYFSTKNKGTQKGMGLGLAICYSIVTKHDGAIKIESEPGKGTVVELYFPAFDENSSLSADAVTEDVQGSEPPEPRVMVVIDDSNLLDVTERMLKKIGYRVDAFKEGNSALEAYKKAKPGAQSFAVVIVDVTVNKEAGGRDFFHQLQRFDPQVKAIAISGYLDSSAIAELTREGFLDILMKPYRLIELEEVLAKIINGSH